MESLKIKVGRLNQLPVMVDAEYSEKHKAHIYKLGNIEHFYRRGKDALTINSMNRNGVRFVNREKLGEQKATSRFAHQKNIGFIQRKIAKVKAWKEENFGK